MFLNSHSCLWQSWASGLGVSEAPRLQTSRKPSLVAAQRSKATIQLLTNLLLLPTERTSGLDIPHCRERRKNGAPSQQETSLSSETRQYLCIPQRAISPSLGRNASAARDLGWEIRGGVQAGKLPRPSGERNTSANKEHTIVSILKTPTLSTHNCLPAPPWRQARAS